MSENRVCYNPSNEQRYEILWKALNRENRLEDYDSILELLGPPPDIYQYASPGSLKNKKVGVIGAGLAGLTAAYELRKLGAEITVFDANEERIGGRVYTVTFNKEKESHNIKHQSTDKEIKLSIINQHSSDKETKSYNKEQQFSNKEQQFLTKEQQFLNKQLSSSKKQQYFGEVGAMRIPISHETVWHYINLFGLNTETLTNPASNNFLYSHNVRLRRTRSGEHIVKELYPLYDLSKAERNTAWPELENYAAETMLKQLSPSIRRQILQILPIYNEEYANITNFSNRQIMERLGLSQGAINLIADVNPFGASLYTSSHNTAMSSLYTLDFLNLYRICGGMIKLPMAFFFSLLSERPKEFQQPYEYLGKVVLRLGNAVTKIRKTVHDQVYLTYQNSRKEEAEERFDYVICAIPFSTLREIDIFPQFSNQKMQAIRELNYMDAQKTLFFCNNRFWEEDAYYGGMNGGISYTDLPIQSIIYPPDHIPCKYNLQQSSLEPGVLVASYNLGQDALRVSNQQPLRRFEYIKRSVELVHGLPNGYLDDSVISHKTLHWNKEQWARGAFVVEDPGQKVNFLYSIQKPEYNNHIYFAGEHCSTKPGWLQGALYSGKLAANMLAANRIVEHKNVN